MNIEKFRLIFPQFNLISDEQLKVKNEIALMHIPSVCSDCAHYYLVFLMIAHLLTLDTLDNTDYIASASIADVSVTKATLKNNDNKNLWLNLTKYGKEYLILEAKCLAVAKAGIMSKGRKETEPFRG